MIFEFKLDSIEDVQPWGESPNKQIHWFALTQGIYRLKVGDEYLLNYSNEFTAQISEKFPNIRYRGTFVDYYIVRLWEDLIDILPHILEPVPKELQHFLESDYKIQRDWSEKVADWHDKAELSKVLNNDEIWEICENATDWINNRCLDSGYLSPSANIWIWSDENDMIISWDNQEIMVDGIQVWSATRSSYRINRNEFVLELKRFDNQLFSEMAGRVNEICKTWNNEEIYIDFEQLKSEQNNRATWMKSWVDSKHKTDWRKVIEAVNNVYENLLSRN
ncbi:MAG: DUF5984 family protein [Acidobacteriota bacterium]